MVKALSTKILTLPLFNKKKLQILPVCVSHIRRKSTFVILCIIVQENNNTLLLGFHLAAFDLSFNDHLCIVEFNKH